VSRVLIYRIIDIHLLPCIKLGSPYRKVYLPVGQVHMLNNFQNEDVEMVRVVENISTFFHTCFLLYLIPSCKSLAIAVLVLSCSIDVLIAGSLCILLIRSRTGFKR